MRHSLQTEQWLPFPVGTVFAFFAIPMNLPKLMLPAHQAKVEEVALRSPAPPPEGAAKNITAAGMNTRFVLSLRPFPFLPLRLQWHALIEEFEWNDHFCDVQEKGPFAYWRHCHRTLPETQDGVEGTLLRDELEYEHRDGIGEVIDRLFGKKQIEKIFAYRHEQTLRLLPKFAPLLKF